MRGRLTPTLGSTSKLLAMLGINETMDRDSYFRLIIRVACP